MISVVLYGRNDSHGYNLHRRAALSLNCIAEILTDPDDEIVFVDYNTPPELPTLVEALADTLTETCRERLRVLRVPAATHDALLRGRTHLAAVEPVARNVAIRRSSPANRWVLSTNSDMVFVPAEGLSLSDIVRSLDDGYYGLPRYEIPEWLWERLDRSDPRAAIGALRELGPSLHLDEITYSHEWVRFDAPGDFQLALRDDLFAIDGLDEEMILGYHVDSNLSRRLFLLRGEIKGLEQELSGYHCNHTRTPTVYHGSRLVQNDLDRFFYSVDLAELPRQHEAWGLPGADIEEIWLTRSRMGEPTAALLAIVPPSGGSMQPSDATGPGFRITYDSAHVLSFVADALAVAPRSATVAYLGANGVLCALLEKLVRALEFDRALVVLDPASPGPGTRLAFADADIVVLDLGLDRSAAADPPTGPLPELLTRVFETLVAALPAERKRQVTGGAPRQFVLINGSSSNLWEPFVSTSFVCSYTTINSRVERAYLKTEPDPGTGDELGRARRLIGWLQSRQGRGAPLHVSLGSFIDILELESYAAFGAGWCPPEPDGLWIAAERATLALQPDHVDGGELLVQLRVSSVCAELGDGVAVDTTANGVPIDHSVLPAHHTNQIWGIVVPSSLADPRGVLVLEFTVEGRRSPASLGWGDDHRMLGFQLGGLGVYPLATARHYEPGSEVNFARGGGSERYQVGAWTASEPSGVWMNGERARLELVLDRPPAPELEVVATAGALVTKTHPSREVAVSANGHPIARWRFDLERHDGPRRALLSAGLLDRDGRILLEFAADAAPSPQELGLGEDPRRLGLHLRTLSVVPVDRKLAPGAILDLTTQGDAERYLGDGWSWPERTGVWTEGEHATIEARLEPGPETDMELLVRGRALVAESHPHQDVGVEVNGTRVAEWTFDLTASEGEWIAAIPKGLIPASGEVRIAFRVTQPISPLVLGLSGDSRPLGLHVESLRIAPRTRGSAAPAVQRRVRRFPGFRTTQRA